MIKLFAVVNAAILDDLDANLSATYTRIHYLINGLRDFPDLDVKCIHFKQLTGKTFLPILYNNLIKTKAAIQSAAILAANRPVAFFVYPHSLTTIQNRCLFHLCSLLQLDIVLDIQDTIEQAQAIGTGKSTLNKEQEGYYFKKADLALALNPPMWNHLMLKYKINSDKQVAFVPNAYEENLITIFPDRYKSVDRRFNICYLGGLTKNRGIELLLEACQQLRKRHPYLRLFLYGSYGESMPMGLKKAIEDSDFIIRTQIPRKDLPDALHDVDLFVMPYDPKESYMNFSSPTKLFEYIGTAKPIICTKCESLVEIGKDGGIIYIDYDALDLEMKIEMLISNPEIREKLSEDLIRIRPSHTWKERAKTVHDALMRL